MPDLPDTPLGQFFKRLLYDIEPKREKSAKQQPKGNYKYIRGKVYLIQHLVINFVSDFQQVSGFLRVLQFPPPIKLTATI
jgi:hypothetical protein